MSYNIEHASALIVVDVQTDFFEDGALAVSGSNAIVPVIQDYLEKFSRAHTPIFFTRDWHPADHCSFREQGGPWPAHCVQGTPGAMFHPRLQVPSNAIIISKAQWGAEDAYSGFQKTHLHASLVQLSIARLFVCGLATDYCVKQTVIDGLKLGYEVMVLEDAVKGVDLKPWDSRNALCEMREAGARRGLIGDFR